MRGTEPSAPPIARPAEAGLLVVVITGGVAAATATSVPGAVITLIGGVVVALIAARTAGARLTQQLASERQRHRETLEAERDRHTSQLAHERTLADLDDLRRLLDQAAGALQRAEVVFNGAARGGGAADLAAEVTRVGYRVRVRLGPVDDITVAYAEAQTRLTAFADETPPPPERRQRRQGYLMACDDFYSASADRVGSGMAAR